MGRAAEADEVRRTPPERSLISWADELARRYVAGADDRRWRHAQGARRQAEHVGARLLPGPERELLVAAAIVHDIGYAESLVRTGFHPLDGARFLAAEGAPPRMCALVAHHTAAVATAGACGLKTEVAAFPDERGVVRDALWYCDLTTGPTGDRVTFEQRMAEIRARHEPGSATLRGLDAGGRLAREAAVRRTRNRLAATTVPAQRAEPAPNRHQPAP